MSAFPRNIINKRTKGVIIMSELVISKNRSGDTLTVIPEGRIDTATSPQLDTAVKNELEGIMHLVIDLEKVSYISSSGLRILLSFHKAMNAKNGELTVEKPTEMVLEVFEVTGFSDMLNIKQ